MALMKSNPETGSKGKGKGKGKGGVKSGALSLVKRGSIVINPATGKPVGTLKTRKIKRNPSDLAGTVNAMLKTDGMQILEGAALYLGARFVLARVVAPVAPVAWQPRVREYAPAIAGLAGAAFELYRGKKTAAIVCLSAGVIGQITEKALPMMIAASGGVLSGTESGPFLSGERDELEGETYLAEVSDEETSDTDNY